MGILNGAVLFAIAAMIAAVLGFGGVAESLADVAQVLFFAFVAAAAVFGILGFAIYKKVVSN